MAGLQGNQEEQNQLVDCYEYIENTLNTFSYQVIYLLDNILEDVYVLNNASLSFEASSMASNFVDFSHKCIHVTGSVFDDFELSVQKKQDWGVNVANIVNNTHLKKILKEEVKLVEMMNKTANSTVLYPGPNGQECFKYGQALGGAYYTFADASSIPIS